MNTPNQPRRILGEVTLTAGNLRNSHIYVTPFKHLLPTDIFGGSNKDEPASRMAVIHYGAVTPVESDIPNDKNLFRNRSWAREFLARTGARPGDIVRFEASEPHTYHISLVRS
ncbi:hypothetical protein [Paracoccus sp. PAR01]|uniref:hypothetical protein n=1 Tax=Paracoccus sp. PAR01 TaxID=2769282 RepID=UPI00177BFD05|nr:hypothetical protein [Paracoccus sp. PAR01]MBD9529143.1 hypothetical protein [Paracoccus sp. PAR01]